MLKVFGGWMPSGKTEDSTVGVNWPSPCAHRRARRGPLAPQSFLAPVFTPPPRPWAFPVSQAALIPTQAPELRSSCCRSGGRRHRPTAARASGGGRETPRQPRAGHVTGFMPSAQSSAPWTVGASSPSPSGDAPWTPYTVSHWHHYHHLMRTINVCSHACAEQEEEDGDDIEIQAAGVGVLKKAPLSKHDLNVGQNLKSRLQKSIDTWVRSPIPVWRSGLQRWSWYFEGFMVWKFKKSNRNKS